MIFAEIYSVPLDPSPLFIYRLKQMLIRDSLKSVDQRISLVISLLNKVQTRELAQLGKDEGYNFYLKIVSSCQNQSLISHKSRTHIYSLRNF